MKKTAGLSAAFLLAVGLMVSRTQTVEAQVLSTTSGGQQIINIYHAAEAWVSPEPGILSLPDDYNSTSTSYPLLVFMHGAGEGGCAGGPAAIYNSSSAGGPSYFRERGQFPSSFVNPANGQSYKFIVLSPQHPCGWSYNGGQINNIINRFVQDYRVDTSRIYVTGLSAGGEGTMQFAIHDGISVTYRAAAVVPMSPATSLPNSTQLQTVINDNTKTWFFGSAPADTWGVRAQEISDGLNAISSGFSRFSNYAGGHCCWNNFYNPTYKENIGGTMMNIYEWMLQYQRTGGVNQPPIATMTAPANNSTVASGATVNLAATATDSDGTISKVEFYQGTNKLGEDTTSPYTYAWTNVPGGTQTISARAIDNQGAINNSSPITLNVTATLSPYGGTARAIPGTIQVEDYDNGGQGTAYNDTTPANQGGAYRTSEAVDVAADDGGHIVGWTVDGEWMKYSVNVATAGNYSLQLRVATPNAGKTLRIEMDGTTVATVSIPNTGGWGTWQTITVNNVPLSAGPQVMRLLIQTGSSSDSQGYNINSIVFVAPANVLPTAIAGTDKVVTLPTNSTTLTGSGTDSDGTIASYAWTKISGPTASITSANSASTNVTGLVQGVYTFRLTVTDNAGGIGSDDIVVTVNTAGNLSPLAVAGNDQTITLPTSSVTLNGSGTDSDGTIASYLWTKVSGGAATITSPTSASTTVTGLAVGSYVFRLTVTDNGGSTATDDIAITVNPLASCATTRSYLYAAGDGSVFGLPAVSPGHTFVLRSDQVYTWMYFDNVHGTSDCPITITNEGQVTMQAGINFTNSSHIKILGNGTPGVQYGIKVENTTPGNSFGIKLSNHIDDVEIAHVYINNTKYGFHIKQEAAWNEGGCDPALQYPNIVIKNVSIHDSKITNTESQGFYIGTTAPNGGRQSNCPPEQGGLRYDIRPGHVENIKIYNNYVDSTGRSGIQLSSASGVMSEIYGNVVRNSGKQYDDAQGHNIVLGGYTRAYVHDNNLSGTFVSNIASLGATELRIENNTMEKNSMLDNQRLAWPWSIFVDTRETIPVTNTKFIIRNNTITNTYGTGGANNILVGYSRPTYESTGNIVCGNTVNGGIPAVYVPPAVQWTNTCGSNNPPRISMPNDFNLNPPVLSTGVLTPTVTDSDGTVVAYQWTQTKGPVRATIESPTSLSTNISGLTLPGFYNFVLRATDNNGASAASGIIVGQGYGSVNMTPNVALGADMVYPYYGTPYVISVGSYLGNEAGELINYEWSVVSGSGVVIGTPSGTTTADSPNPPSTSLSNLTPGQYIIRLTATDAQGQVGYDQLSIKIGSAETNTAPIAIAGTDKFITTSNTTLTASGIDDDGTIESYSWRKVYGGQATIASPNSATTQINGLQSGSYLFEVRAVDDDGADSTDQVAVVVNGVAANELPVANAGFDITAALPTTSVTLNGSGTDNDGTIATYAWTKLSGGPATITSPNSASTTVTGLAVGAYVFRLTVTDNGGMIDTDDMVVTITVSQETTNLPPVVSADTDKIITLPVNAVSLAGTATDSDGTIASYLWTKVSGGAATIVSPGTLITSITGLAQGAYEFRLTVTDDDGATSSDNVLVTVNPAVTTGGGSGGGGGGGGGGSSDSKPTANAGQDITVILPAKSATLVGAGFDKEGAVTYEWSRASGKRNATIASPNSATTLVNNLEKGEYTFRLTVRDGSGNTATDTVIVNVFEPGGIKIGGNKDTGIPTPTNTSPSGSSSSSFVVTANTAVRVRTAPSTTASQISSAGRGATGKILEKNGVWTKVQLDNQVVGWVSSLYIAETASAPVNPPVPVQNPTPASGSVTVIPLALNIRSAPEGAVIGKAVRGTVGSVISKNGQWTQVQFNTGLSGWVSSAYLSGGSSAGIQISAPAPTQTVIVPAQQPQIGNTGIVRSTVTVLNVRSAPAGQIIAKVTSGTSGIIIPGTNSGVWVKVRFTNGIEGYVDSRYVR